MSKKFFECVDAVTRDLPHTNMAAATARTEAESMVHHLGFPSFFVTFTPDDQNSYLLQVYSGVTIDDGTPICELTDEQLAARCKERKELRINAPGMAAQLFEVALDTVLSEVFGIDPDTMCPTGIESHFGVVCAALVTVEEQG